MQAAISAFGRTFRATLLRAFHLPATGTQLNIFAFGHLAATRGPSGQIAFAADFGALGAADLASLNLAAVATQRHGNRFDFCCRRRGFVWVVSSPCCSAQPKHSTAAINHTNLVFIRYSPDQGMEMNLVRTSNQRFLRASKSMRPAEALQHT